MSSAYEIFTPNGVPTLTYVRRELSDKAGNKFYPEEKLFEQLSIPGRVVSIAGPSKSGKTALVETVVGKNNIVKISGAQIKDPESIWMLVLEQLNIPVEKRTVQKKTDKESIRVDTKIEIGNPLLKGSAGIAGEEAIEYSDEVSNTFQSNYQVAVLNLKKNGKTLFIDDFHYMSEENQKATAEIVKHAAEHDLLSICVAQVRHKNDLVIRMNPDLTGRLTNIDFDLWSRDDIAKIAIGFELLNIDVSDSVIDAFSTESGGSPQIMQSICLSACIKNKSLTRPREKIYLHAKNIDINTIISSCIETIDRDRLATRLEAGPPTHGTDRLSFDIINGTTLDVYGCILAAIALNPPWLEIKKSQLIDRVGFITKNDTPNTSSILRSLTHMQSIARKYDVFNDYIEWDDDKGLQILDPYLLFYIRWIKKFRSIREAYELTLSSQHPTQHSRLN